MSLLFGSLGEGKTVCAFGALAAAATLGAIAFGAEAERYAQARRPAIVCDNAVDYATTGAVERRSGQRELVALGPCGEASDRR
jgi:hypothetical protein